MGERMGIKFRFLIPAIAVSLFSWVACSSRSTTTTGTGTGVLYYATQGDSNIWAYTVALSTGGLTQVGTAQSTGSFPTTIVLTPTVNAIFVDNNQSHTVSSYTVNGDGSLTAASGSPVKTGIMPMGMATDPAGKFLFVANQGSSSISVFSISTATLKEVAGSPFSTIPLGTNVATGPTAVAVSATGKFLYVANNFVGTVGAFSISSSGALKQLGTSPYQVGIAPSGLAIPPGGGFLYVANAGSNNVSAFSICDKVVTSCANPNSPDGTLTSLGAPFPAGQGPVAIAADPLFNFLYVLDKESNQISEYQFAPGTGVLSPLSTPAVSTGLTPTSIVIISGTIGSNAGSTLTNPTDYVYVTNNGASTLSAFTLNTTTGILSPLGQAITTTGNPSAVAAN